MLAGSSFVTWTKKRGVVGVVEDVFKAVGVDIYSNDPNTWSGAFGKWVSGVVRRRAAAAQLRDALPSCCHCFC
jgi:hypothetical protein